MGSRAKLTVAYLGGAYHGWQQQPSGRTVQGELVRALEEMTHDTTISVVGAGRTDAGVHAAGQVAHCDLPAEIPQTDLVRALNQHLPRDIRVRSAGYVRPSFHARRDAVAKHYTYRVRWRSPDLPWLDLRTATCARFADRAAVQTCSEMLVGRFDVASFTVPEAAVHSTVRRLHRVWLQDHGRGLDLHFVGDGFLRYQVRRMVGALLAVGREELTAGGFRALIEDPHPGAPIVTAPACGLTLEKVYYRSVPSLGF
jgi:tRNA pseudouridine38-40 synthase